MASSFLAPGARPSGNHLNRYLYLASKGELARAAAHLEPGAQIDQALVAVLGRGPFSGGRDDGFVNGRLYFVKDQQPFYADFGPTGRLVRIGVGHPAQEEQIGQAESPPCGRFTFVTLPLSAPQRHSSHGPSSGRLIM